MFASQGARYNTRSASVRYSYSSKLAKPNVVQPLKESVGVTSHETAEQPPGLSSDGSSGTLSQPEMGPVRLEGLWRSKLVQQGWSMKCSQTFPFCIAPSTLQAYNKVLDKLEHFCADKKVSFPPREVRVLAEFLCSIAEQSQRPSSVLNVATAALGHVYRILELPDLPGSYAIRTFVCALVKSGTSVPMTRSKVMPIRNFHDLFLGWDENKELDLKSLRLKVITLLALTVMLRPSDIAPNARHVSLGEEEKVVFKVDQVSFSEQGAKLQFFGIKNDTSRTGFEVLLPQSSIPKLDPVQTLKDYIRRTESQRPENGALFLTLRPPYKALEAASVARVLDEAIGLAGLGGQGFSAKSFRPTGATAAIEQGVNAETVRKIGRWKDSEVFFGHYVHAKTPGDFTDNVIHHS